MLPSVRMGTGGPAQGNLEAGLEEGGGRSARRNQPLPASDPKPSPELPAWPLPSMVAYPAGP